MTGGVTVPSVSGGQDLPLSENGGNDPYDLYPDFHVEWVRTPPETTILPIHVDLSIVTEPGKIISLLIFQNNQELKFDEVTRVLGEKGVPPQRQRDYIQSISSCLGLANRDGTTDDSGYFRATIKCDLAGRSTYLNLVRNDEGVGSSGFDQMRLDNSFDHNRVTRPRLPDLNVEPEPDNEDLLISLNTTSWNYEATEALPEINDYWPMEDFQPMNYRGFEATALQFHDHQAPQYPHSLSVDRDTALSDLYFELVDLLEMEFTGSEHMEIDNDGNADIMTILESMNTYVATTIPASQSAIKELEKVRIESVEAAKHAGVCAVCMEDFEVGVEATRLPCLHLYHGGCVVPWLEINHQCPLCRFPMLH